MVEVEVDAGDGTPPQHALALNDVAVKSRGVSVVRLRVEADAELFGEFDADGMVVSTATGSTAYALSAGGPPIDPRVRAIAVVPIAPHAVITRPIVLPEMTVVVITVRRGTVFVAADGQDHGTVGDGGVVTVRAGPELAVVRFPDSPSFLRRLRDKVRFGLPLKEIEHDHEHDAIETESSGRRPGDSKPSPTDMEAPQ
jgi:NAD+ kinase